MRIQRRHQTRDDEHIAKGCRAQYQEHHTKTGQRQAHPVGTALVYGFLAHTHEHRSQNWVDDQRHKQRRAQNDNERDGQILHELPDQTRPNGKRHKRSQRGCRRGDDGPSHLTHTKFRGGDGGFAFIHQTIDILHDHNAIVHQHAERQYQREQNHHIEGDAQCAEDHERHEHGQRNGDPDEEGVAQPKEEQQDADHEQDAEDDRVLQLLYLRPSLVGLVVGDAHIEVGREVGRLSIGYDAVDAIGSGDEVFTGAFDDVERHHRLEIFPGVARLLLFHESNRGDIAEVDGGVRLAFDDDVFDVFHGLEITDHLHGAAVVVDQQVATGDRHVLLGNRIRDVVKTGLHGFGTEVVDDNLNLLVHDPADVHLGNLRELFDVLFELFGVALQLVQAVIAGEVDVHDGQQLREIQLEHVRVSGQVVWEFRIGFGLVHRVLHLA